MADLFRTCKDGHRCENNALCVESSTEEGSYYCDCDTATGQVAGLSCEFEADNYCQAPQETTSSWFCTNKGTCVRSSSWSCDCPTEYEGPHCEYIAGAKPEDWPVSKSAIAPSSAAAQDGLETGVMVTIILVSIIVGLLLGVLVLRAVRRRRAGEMGDELKDTPSFRKAGLNAPKDQSEALNIEMDGTGFRDAVISSEQSKGTVPFNFDAGIEMDSEMATGTGTTDNAFSPKINGSGSGSGSRHSNGNGNGNGHGMML